MLRYVTSTLAQHVNPVLVETGTYMGDGVRTALGLGFQRVISIELNEDFYRNAKEEFSADNRVTILQGDSALMLWDAIKDVPDRMTFWLDGHVFPGQEDLNLGLKPCPLIEELEQISRHPIKNHVIMIDDMSSLPKGGIYKNPTFSQLDIEDAVRRINGGYNISYFDRGGTKVLLAS